jgi:hypothetical protein
MTLCVTPIHSVNIPALCGHRRRTLTASTSEQTVLRISTSSILLVAILLYFSEFVVFFCPVILHPNRTRLSLPTQNSRPPG